jgi:hypothetical protein
MSRYLVYMHHLAEQIKYRCDLHYLFWFAFFLRFIYFIIMLTQIPSAELFNFPGDSANYYSYAREFPPELVRPDSMMFTFGPGYGFFIYVFLLVFGHSAIPILVTQIILSSLSCLLIYKLGQMLTGSYITSIIAGLFSALSYTSLSLSSTILSDTLYYFLFLFGLIFYLIALDNGQIKPFLIAGLLTGYAIITRSIGQFWPIVMVIIGVVSVYSKRDISKPIISSLWSSMKKPLLCLAIVAGIVLLWMGRNAVVIGVPYTTAASIGGVGKVALITEARVENKTESDVFGQWVEEFKEEYNRQPSLAKDKMLLWTRSSRNTFWNHPTEFLKTYFNLVGANITDINYIPRSHFPDYVHFIVDMEYYFFKHFRINLIILIMSGLGFIGLILKRKYFSAIILIQVLLYYAAMAGFGRWQGSRLFYPAEIATAILCAVSITTLAGASKKALQRLWRLFDSKNLLRKID